MDQQILFVNCQGAFCVHCKLVMQSLIVTSSDYDYLVHNHHRPSVTLLFLSIYCTLNNFLVIFEQKLNELKSTGHIFHRTLWNSFIKTLSRTLYIFSGSVDLLQRKRFAKLIASFRDIYLKNIFEKTWFGEISRRYDRSMNRYLCFHHFSI